MTRSVALFCAWALVGFLASFLVLYGFTIVGPLLLLMVWLAYRYLPTIAGRRRPEAFGALAGFGAFWLFVAATVEDGTAFALVGGVAVAASVAWFLVGGRERCAGRVPAG
jgi:hypothetical protein